MAVPRNRSSNSAKNQRRSHHAKVAKNTLPCLNCKNLRLPHQTCLVCGYYDGKRVIQVGDNS